MNFRGDPECTRGVAGCGEEGVRVHQTPEPGIKPERR
jgi:hypothetical protein